MAHQREHHYPTNHKAAIHGTRYAHHAKPYEKTNPACAQSRQYAESRQMDQRIYPLTFKFRGVVACVSTAILWRQPQTQHVVF